jgi:hypothetical protein
MTESILIYLSVNTTVFTILLSGVKRVNTLRPANKAPPWAVKLTFLIFTMFQGFLVKPTFFTEH